MKELRATETLVDESLRETKSHGTEGFPMAVYLDDFSDFENGYICWHWHEEVQITLIMEGDFQCQVEKTEMILHPGDAIFINSGLLHQIRPCQTSVGKLYSFIWKAELFSGGQNSDIYKNCVIPVIKNSETYVFFEKNKHGEMEQLLNQVVSLYTEKKRYFQMKIQNLLGQIWLKIGDRMPDDRTKERPEKIRDDARVKLALQFMQAHYDEDLSLEEIARAALISRSELCRCFRRTLNMPPKEFLLQYRIRQATVLLKNPDLRIADVAETTGFSSPSHFGSYFHKYMGCTPREYRKSL